MKKICTFTLASLLLFAGNLFAQNSQNAAQIDQSSNKPTYNSLEKGTFTFSLNGSANNSKNKAGWSLTPQAGYLVADRLIVGLQLSVANRFSKLGNSWGSLKRGGIREYAFTPEVYTRYYVLPFRFTPFVQLSSGYTIGEFSVNNGYSDNKVVTKTNNYVMFGAAGLSLRIGKNMGLQAQYNLPLVADSKTSDMIRSNRFRLGLSLYLK